MSGTPSVNEIEEFLRAADMGKTADVLKFLDQYGAGLVDVHNVFGTTALMNASWSRRVDTVSLLLEKGAAATKQNIGGNNALMMAACQGNKDIVLLLLEHDADIAATSGEGKTVSMLAQQRGHSDIAALLGQWPEMKREKEEREAKQRQEAYEAQARASRVKTEGRIDKIKQNRPLSPFCKKRNI